MTSDQNFLPGDEPHDDVEGHARRHALPSDEATEDVEGHRPRWNALPADEPVEDDVEGHVNPKGL